MDLTSLVDWVASLFKPVKSEWDENRLVVKERMWAYAMATISVLLVLCEVGVLASGFTLDRIVISVVSFGLLWLLVYGLSRGFVRTITVDKKLKLLTVEQSFMLGSKRVRMSLEGFNSVSLEEIPGSSWGDQVAYKIVVTTKRETRTILQTGGDDSSEIVSAINSFLFDEDIVLTVEEAAPQSSTASESTELN